MSRYNDAARGAPQPESDDGRCHAHGCPLPGAISDSTKGGGPWFCRHHFGREPNQWQAITETVRVTLREREQGDYLPSDPYGSVGAPMEPDHAHARISEPA